MDTANTSSMDAADNVNSASLRELLLSKEAQQPSHETTSNPSNEDISTPPPPPPPSAVLLGCCTLALVLLGIGLILLAAFLPLWIFLVVVLLFYGPIVQHHQDDYWPLLVGFVVISMLLVLHVRALWVSARYLYVMRTLVLPVRKLVFPLVPVVARIESIRQQESTQFYVVTNINTNESDNNDNATTSQQQQSPQEPQFRKSVRRHYKRMQKIYQRHTPHIRHVCVRAEPNLVLRDVIPLVWQHQQRSTQTQFPLVDFIQRALVVTVVPDGILDLYYYVHTNSHNHSDNSNQNHPPTIDSASNNDDLEELVSVQFSILQGPVWHWFMYFCKDHASHAGIWWHGALLAIHRGHHHSCCNHNSNGCPVQWVNAQTHQRESKLHAGYQATSNTGSSSACQQGDNDARVLLDNIYPWKYTTRLVPEELLQIRLWD